MLKLKGNKGITLIALIITIIVLLILAGVTISAINGNENTMGKAKIAKEENEIANELEAIKLAITDAMAKGLNGKVSDVHLRESIAGIIDDSELNNISGEGPWTIKTKLGKTYEINGYGQIQESVVLEPTDIYVALDGNTLRFYSQKDNVSGTLYNDSNVPINLKGVDFTTDASCPWYNSRTSITRASIEDVIVPTSTARWFNECAITGVDHIENLKTNCVTDMNRMFRNCSNLESIDVSKFDTSNVTDMSTMFQLCSKLTTLDVSNFKTGKVENMQWMFNGCSGLTELDLSNWDTANVTIMYSMFYNCSNLTTIYVGDKWNTDAVTQSEYMFTNCNNLTGGAGTIYSSSYRDKSRAKIDGGISDPGYLTHINEKGKIKLKLGDYINYTAHDPTYPNDPTKTIVIPCRVLYNDNENGLQIISINSVRDVTLGKDDIKITDEDDDTLEKAQKSYNRAIITLNEYASEYKNENDNNLTLDARCVGSLPTINEQRNAFSEKNKAKLSNGTDITNEYYNNAPYKQELINGKGIKADANYSKDQAQLSLAKIGCSQSYFLASRKIYYGSTVMSFQVYSINNQGKLHPEVNSEFNYLWYVKNTLYNPSTFANVTNGFRPIFLITSNIKAISGTGSSTDPYILEVKK